MSTDRTVRAMKQSLRIEAPLCIVYVHPTPNGTEIEIIDDGIRVGASDVEVTQPVLGANVHVHVKRPLPPIPETLRPEVSDGS